MCIIKCMWRCVQTCHIFFGITFEVCLIPYFLINIVKDVLSYARNCLVVIFSVMFDVCRAAFTKKRSMFTARCIISWVMFNLVLHFLKKKCMFTARDIFCYV